MVLECAMYDCIVFKIRNEQCCLSWLNLKVLIKAFIAALQKGHFSAVGTVDI